jgi:hypothetical protein
MRRFDSQALLTGALWVIATIALAVALVDSWRDIAAVFRP